MIIMRSFFLVIFILETLYASSNYQNTEYFAKKCDNSNLDVFVKYFNDIDYQITCSAVSTAINFAKHNNFFPESISLQKAIVIQFLNEHSENGVPYINNRTAYALSYDFPKDAPFDLINVTPFNGSFLRKSFSNMFGINISDTHGLSKKQRETNLEWIHYSVIVHEVTHVLTYLYRDLHGINNLTYGQQESIAYIAQLESLPHNLSGVFIEFNRWESRELNVNDIYLYNKKERNDNTFGINAYISFKKNKFKIINILSK